MTNFKIETVKWKWADKVQSKEVYRDDEFVRAKTPEESLAAIDFLMQRPQGLTYTITVVRDGEYFTYYRHSMPCLGGLVKYRDSHGEKHFMNPYFPRDIRVAYPDGDTVFIACHRPDCVAALKTPYYEFVFSLESPWISAFGTRETIIFKDNYFVLTNMDTNPTALYSLMRLAGFAYSSVRGNRNPKAEILALKTPQADPRRLAGQKPIITSGTWAQGYGYTRPYNESIFKTVLPTKFKDFGKLAGYPGAHYTNNYYVTAMRDQFGVDVSNGACNASTQLDDVLVKAWEYFKEESKSLGDGFPK